MASTKGPWEERVGKLLIAPDFVWSYKPPDTMWHSGQTKIDWLASDRVGKFWMIEVKQLPESRKSFNLDSEDFISAGQILALTAVAQASASVSILVVGRGRWLYVYDWRRLLWRYQENVKAKLPKPGLISLDLCDFKMEFTRWAKWQAIAFRHQVLLAQHTSRVRGLAIPRTPKKPSASSSKPEKSPSTSKRTGSTPTRRTQTSKPNVALTGTRMRLSGQ